MSCNYNFIINGKVVSAPTNIQSRGGHSIQELKKAFFSIGKNEKDINVINSLIKDFEATLKQLESTIKIPQDISSVQVGASAVGVTSLLDVIQSLNISENELGMPIEEMILKLNEDLNIPLNKLNVINGDYSSAPFNLATRYIPKSDIIILNTNHFIENVYADLLKALIDQYIYNYKDIKAVTGFEAEELSSLLVKEQLTDSENNAINKLAELINLEPSILRMFIDSQVVKVTPELIDFNSSYNSVSKLQELFNVSKNNTIYYSSTKKVPFNVSMLKYGDIIILDVDGQRITKKGELTTEESLKSYIKYKLEKSKDKKIHFYPNGQSYMFLELSKDKQRIKLYNTAQHKIEWVYSSDPRLFWTEDESQLYDKNGVRQWMDKSNLESKFMKVKILNQTNENNSLQVQKFLTEADFNKALKESQKKLTISAIQSKEKFDPSISKVLNVGDYFKMKHVDGNHIFYIREKRETYFEVEYVSNNKVIAEKIYFNSINPSVVYFNPSNLFDIQKDKHITSAVLKVNENNVTTTSSRNVLDVGDVVRWQTSKGEKRYNYIIGVGKNQTVKILVQKNTDSGIEFISRELPKEVLITGVIKNQTYLQQKEKLNKINFDIVKNMLHFPGDERVSNYKYNYVQTLSTNFSFISAIIAKLTLGDIVHVNNQYIYVIDNSIKGIFGIDKEGNYLEIPFSEYSNISEIFYQNQPEDIYSTLTNHLNLIYVTPNAKMFGSENDYTEVRLFLKQSTYDKLNKLNLDSLSDFRGAKWSSKESIDGYVDVTQQFYKVRYKEKKAKPLYRVTKKGSKIIMTNIIDHSYISKNDILKDINEYLKPGMYVVLKAWSKLPNNQEAGLRWFRVIEHKDNKYLLNYSAYDSDGDLASYTIIVDDEFMSNNFEAVKTREEDNSFQRRSLTSCRIQLTPKQPERVIDITIDRILSRLGIEIRKVTSEQMQEKYGLNVAGFVTTDETNKPIMIINSNSENLAKTQLHELMHLILGTLKVRDPNIYNNIVSTIYSYAKKIKQLKQIVKTVDEQYKGKPQYLKQEEVVAEVIANNMLDSLSSYIESQDERQINIKQLLKLSLEDFFKKEDSIFSKLDEVGKERLDTIVSIVFNENAKLGEINNYIYDPRAVAQAFNMEILKEEYINSKQLIENCK